MCNLLELKVRGTEENAQRYKQAILKIANANNKPMGKCLTLLKKEVQTKPKRNAIFVFQNGND